MTAVATQAEKPGFAEHTVRTIDVKRVYKMGTEEVHALKGVSVAINRGEYISIMGPSGSGKSTFFNMIGGLDKPSEGKVYIDEVDIAQLDSYELAWMRCQKIGYIFQTFNLIPVMTALENVQLPMVFAGLSTAEAQEKAADILKRVELGHRMFNRPSEMSGGQQQRVAIARAFANDPAIILADEPTGNLDLNTGKLIIKLLRQLNEERGVTIITATHDHKMLAISDRIIWIEDGKVAKISDRSELNIEEGTIAGPGWTGGHGNEAEAASEAAEKPE
ncbi:MAG: ABC transporter ATP-binding protein [Phycisphaerae bacterium]